MSWPLSHDFNEAVQTPQLAFQDPDLKGGETVVGATGLPLPRSGNFADVYQVRGADGREWAVKCFTRPVVGLAERYAKVSDALSAANLPFIVGFTYYADGIRVGGAWRPVVKMEWVEGLLLNQVVRDNTGSTKVLTALGGMWAKLCKRLREANVAHADIQHGNVLLVPGSRPGAYGLKLIDYDGMWVKALANTPSGESGHPSYQHPGRAGGRVYSPDVDRFPHLAVATALRGLVSGGAALWEKYDNGDNLLFTEGDFKKPADSKLMRELWKCGDPAAEALVGRLAVACGKPVPQTPWLDQLAPDGEPAVLDDSTRREAAAALGMSLPVPVEGDWGQRAAPPLPPEPRFEVVEEPPAPPPPPPSKPAKAIVVVEEEEDEPVAAKVRKPEPRSRRAKAQKSQPVVAYVAAGVLAVVLVVVLVVALRPKSDPVAQKNLDPDPVEPVKQPVVPPKPPVIPPKPKDTIPPKKEPDPKVDDKKDPDKNPPDKKTETPPKPKEPRVLKARWSAEVRTEGVPATLHARGTTVVFGTERTPLTALDLASGVERPFANAGLTGGHAFAPLAGDRVAKYSDGDDVRTWDTKTGQTKTTYAVPANFPPGDGAAKALLTWLAPSANFMAVARGTTAPTIHPKELPLSVFAIDKTNRVVRPPKHDTTWRNGTVHFTANSSQVLVAEYNGRFRWLDMAGDDVLLGWNFKAAEEGVHRVTDMDGGGQLLGYNGPAQKADDDAPAASPVPHILNARTGAVVQRFGDKYLASSPVSLSTDGRVAAVLREPADGMYTVAIVSATAKDEVIALATVPSDGPPPFALSDDGRVLIVHRPKAGKMECFNVP